MIGLDSAVYVLFGQKHRHLYNGQVIALSVPQKCQTRNGHSSAVQHYRHDGIYRYMRTVSLYSVCREHHSRSRRSDSGSTHFVQRNNDVVAAAVRQASCRLSEKILPDKKSSRRTVADKWFEDVTTNSRHILGSSAVALQSLRDDVLKMLYLTVENVTMGFDAVITGNTDDVEKINRNEEKVDRFNFEISQKIAKLLTVEQSPVDIKEINRLFSTISDIERISDHSVNSAISRDAFQTRFAVKQGNLSGFYRNAGPVQTCVVAVGKLQGRKIAWKRYVATRTQ